MLFNNNIANHPLVMERKWEPKIETAPNCPRCASPNTKFCYYNNYSLSQPRYFCKGCKRYWTKGGSLRNVPVGGGCRKSRRSKSSKASDLSRPGPNPATAGESTNGSGGGEIDLAAVFANYLSHSSSSGEEYSPSGDQPLNSLDTDVPFEEFVIEYQNAPDCLQPGATTLGGEDGVALPQASVGENAEVLLELLQYSTIDQEFIGQDILWSSPSSSDDNNNNNSSIGLENYAWQEAMVQIEDFGSFSTNHDDNYNYDCNYNYNHNNNNNKMMMMKMMASSNNNVVCDNWSSSYDMSLSGYEIFSRP